MKAEIMTFVSHCTSLYWSCHRVQGKDSVVGNKVKVAGMKNSLLA